MVDHGGDALVAGRFRVEGLLGVGGSASVFDAVDELRGDRVALKVLHPALAADAGARAAFALEVEAARTASHRALAALIDHGDHDAVWIAYERVEGSTLAEWVEQLGPLDVMEALGVIDSVLSALAALHRVGYVHRDLSPANVMLDRDAAGGVDVHSVRVIDLGLAAPPGRPATRAVGDHGALVAVGSLGYLAPEQSRGEPVDARVDVYGAGAVLHFALTGRAPFERATVAGMLHAHQASLPPVPSSVRRDVPRDVDRIVVRAMLATADRRFTTVEEMRRAVVEASRRAKASTASALTAPASKRGTVLAQHPLRPVDLGQEIAPDAVITARLPLADSIAGTHSVGAAGGGSEPSRSARRRGGRGAGASSSGRHRLAALLMFVMMASAVVIPIWAVAASMTPERVPAASASPAAPSQPLNPKPADPIAVEPPPAPMPVTVPALTGSLLTDARALLESAGLRAGEVLVQHSNRPADTVLAASVGHGAQVVAGTAVQLTIASGRNLVPAVVGLAQSPALIAVQDAGFIVHFDARPSATAPPGTVLAVVPGEASDAALGSAVTLVIALPDAEQPGVPTPAPTPTSPPTPAPTAPPDSTAPPRVP